MSPLWNEDWPQLLIRSDGTIPFTVNLIPVPFRLGRPSLDFGFGIVIEVGRLFGDYRLLAHAPCLLCWFSLSSAVRKRCVWFARSVEKIIQWCGRLMTQLRFQHGGRNRIEVAAMTVAGSAGFELWIDRALDLPRDERDQCDCQQQQCQPLPELNQFSHVPWLHDMKQCHWHQQKQPRKARCAGFVIGQSECQESHRPHPESPQAKHG